MRCVNLQGTFEDKADEVGETLDKAKSKIEKAKKKLDEANRD